MRHRLAGLALLAGGACALPFAALAQNGAVAAMGTAFPPVEAADLSFENGSAQAVPEGTSAGKGFVTIRNRGREPDRLTAISSPSSRETRLYRRPPEGEPARVDGLEIPAGGAVTMRPDDLYIDFRNVTRPFAPGGEVAVTLTFEKAGSVGLRLPVVPVR